MGSGALLIGPSYQQNHFHASFRLFNLAAVKVQWDSDEAVLKPRSVMIRC